MLTKNQIKLITQLKAKKYRDREQLFVVEGLKSIKEFLKATTFELYELYTTDDTFFAEKATLITTAELQKISYLTTANTCLAIFKKADTINLEEVNTGLKLVLDDISDPGNLGTIIRLCDWFGISTLYCSRQTVDCYNPKVVQATMGSLNRVNIVYTDIQDLLNQADSPIYGAFMDGKNIYQEHTNKDAFLVIGNEANGISATIENLVTNRVTIPKFGKKQETESLNAAIATGILLSEFMRKQ